MCFLCLCFNFFFYLYIFRLIELDEGIDALDAAMEFKSDAIAQKQKELRTSELTQVRSEINQKFKIYRWKVFNKEGACFSLCFNNLNFHLLS